MTTTADMIRHIREIATSRGVFRPEAYFFVMEALEMKMGTPESSDHITGEDLLESIRDLGRDKYGVMAGDVFKSWQVQGTIDFGRIVFHLVDEGVLRKRKSDSLSDFLDKFDFDEAFALKVYEGRS